MKAGDNSDEKSENNLTKREQYFKVNNVKNTTRISDFYNFHCFVAYSFFLDI